MKRIANQEKIGKVKGLSKNDVTILGNQSFATRHTFSEQFLWKKSRFSGQVDDPQSENVRDFSIFS
jgi:hypothetical protein